MGLPPELAFVFGETENVFSRVRVIAREMVAESTLALTLERPEGFQFEPGQNTAVSIPGKYAEQVREFSIASAPHEKDLIIAMRVRHSQFKNACYELQPGDTISIRKASGSLWRPTREPQIWLSGGIGITPFRSIVRHLLHTKETMPVTHIHSDRSRASAAFIREFESPAAESPWFTFIATMTQESVPEQVRGRITAEKIGKLAPGFHDASIFVVGGESFVGAQRAALSELGVLAEKIRTERFEGYRAEMR